MPLVYNYILNGNRFVIQDGIGQEKSKARKDLLSHFCPTPALVRKYQKQEKIYFLIFVPLLPNV